MLIPLYDFVEHGARYNRYVGTGYHELFYEKDGLPEGLDALIVVEDTFVPSARTNRVTVYHEPRNHPHREITRYVLKRPSGLYIDVAIVVRDIEKMLGAPTGSLMVSVRQAQTGLEKALEGLIAIDKQDE